MVKSHSKLIYILITLFVIATVLLLSSCGSNNPLSAPSAGTPKSGNTNPAAFTSGSNIPVPKPLPKWMDGLPPASISCLLANPNLNLNATGPVKPFNQLCGPYVDQTYTVYYPNQNQTTGIVINHYYPYTTYSTCPDGTLTNSPNYNSQSCSGWYSWSAPTYKKWTIPCDDPCSLGGNFPSDAFTGSGAPNVPYIGGDGSIYTPGGAPTPPPPASEARKLLGVMIDPDVVNIKIAETATFSGTAIYSKPPVVQDITSMITSGDAAIATIANGVVTGVASGQAALKVTFGGYSAVSVVNVGLGTLDSVSVEPSPVQLSKGETKQLKAIAHYPNSVNVDITSNPNTTWTLGNVGSTRAASVNSTGMVTGLASGTAIVQASYQGKKSPVVNVTVLDKKLQSISVSPPTATIYIYPTKGTKQYTASGSYSDGSTGQIASPVTWDTLPGGIATIDANGLATAVSPGTTYITAASDSISSGAQDAELEVLWYRYVHFLQIDPAWTTDPYAWHTLAETKVKAYTEVNTALGTVAIMKGSIGAKGCAMTSVAMGLSTLGINTNPNTLNIDMQNDGYYDGENGVIWDVIKAYSNGNIIGIRYPGSGQIKTELDKGNIVIVNVKYKPASTKYGHWVILEKYKGNTYYSYDPTWGERTFTSLSEFNKVVVGITK